MHIVNWGNKCRTKEEVGGGFNKALTSKMAMEAIPKKEAVERDSADQYFRKDPIFGLRDRRLGIKLILWKRVDG